MRPSGGNARTGEADERFPIGAARFSGRQSRLAEAVTSGKIGRPPDKTVCLPPPWTLPELKQSVTARRTPADGHGSLRISADAVRGRPTT